MPKIEIRKFSDPVFHSWLIDDDFYFQTLTFNFKMENSDDDPVQDDSVLKRFESYIFMTHRIIAFHGCIVAHSKVIPSDFNEIYAFYINS